MPNAFVVKTVKHGLPVLGVFEELKAGRARIGWSWLHNLDLRLLHEKIKRGEPLDGDEQDARRCLGFLTRVNPKDYLLYPHQPRRGQFSVVQVTGDYGYSAEQDSLVEDFRSFRPCLLKTPEPVDMDDPDVPSQLSYRMGVPGRFSQISDTSSLLIFLEALASFSNRRQVSSKQARVERIHNELRGKLPEAIHREFSRADLSRNFCSDLFERMGFTPEVQEGPSEAGSDIVVTIGSPLLPNECEFRIGVQVFSYQGRVGESSLRNKLKQLLEGWKDNALDYGVLLTTGRCSEAAVVALHDHNKRNPRKLVRLIEGNELADLFLKHFPPGK